jgi:hypothetical protein
MHWDGIGEGGDKTEDSYPSFLIGEGGPRWGKEKKSIK